MADSGSPSGASSLKKHRKREAAMADSGSPIKEGIMEDLDLGYYRKKVPPQDYHLWRRYRKQVLKSDGFDIFDYPGTFAWAPLVPIILSSGNDDDETDLTMAADLAIYHYYINTGSKYRVSNIVKANVRFVRGVMYYITFEAMEQGNHDPALKTFQAKVYQRAFPSMELEVLFCRLKNEHPHSEEKRLIS